MCATCSIVCDMRRQFEQRARLVVYLETKDLARLTAVARENAKTVIEYARDLILEHLSENADDKAVRGNRAVRVGGRRTAAARLDAVSPSGAKGKVSLETQHPGAGVFNAPENLNEPEYKSHPAKCICFLCNSARQAGLKT